MAEKLSHQLFPMYMSIILLLIFKSTYAQNYDCPNTTMFANNSHYHTNLNTLFGFLSSNATIPSGYYQATVSSNSDNEFIYGHFLCQGDINASSCQNCVTTATNDLPKANNCPNRKVALVWYDECLLRYSNESFFGKLDMSSIVFFVNTANIRGNTARFDELRGNMMNNVIANRAASGGSDKKFATDIANFSTFQTIYGLGQCTPDLSSNDCYTCLVSAIGRFTTARGARMLQPSCVVRYELYVFFNLSSVAPLPPAQPPTTHSSGKGTNITIMNSCSYTVWPAIFTTGGSHEEIPNGFSLRKGESRIINITERWVGTLWGRTLCSFEETTGKFSCKTGECSTGKVDECVGGSSGSFPVTVANFRIGQFDNSDTYFISIRGGYNLAMMVHPKGVSERGRCEVTGCMFNLNNATCPQEFSLIEDRTLNVIACKNPCDVPQKCCKYGELCESSDYSASSRLFQKSCPRANIIPSDLTNTKYSCESYKTSYDVTFCPPSNMVSLFSTSSNTLPASGPSLHPSLAHNSKRKKAKEMDVIVGIVVPIAVMGLLIALYSTYHIRRKAKMSLFLDITNVLEDFTTAESLTFELEALQVATNFFSNDRKLGGGGFGNVYKGTLPNGPDIAVKRLSRITDQGIESFKNEAVLIAKLQHKNLVKLLGFCLTRMEKLLVYEYIPNKSLNYILFDPKRQGELDWSTRYNIIVGIARGLLYLHEDSRPRIIHRDLKAANILLEEDMNPKIADFGLARIFKVEQTEDDTSIVAGTYGYMAPEYAMHGQFSIKSDVYSFGVLLLEIVSGKKINSKLHPSGGGDLLNYAWRSWKDKAPLNFMDPTLGDSCSTNEILRCIHLGLICVQENAHERPTMSTIIFMLNTNSATTTLPMPQRPRFYNNGSIEASQVTRSNQDSTTSTFSDSLMQHTHNLVTISELNPR